MSAAHASTRLGWGAASALVAIATLGCQIATAPASASSAPITSFAPTGETQQATVTDIVDGDTIHVALGGQEFRVRYIGIDAPEIAHDNNPGERLGTEASQANARLVGGRNVILETDTSNTDQFGRLLRYVWLRSDAGWLFVNAELVREGWADAKSYPPDTRDQALLNAAETAAREAGVGIWSAP